MFGKGSGMGSLPRKLGTFACLAALSTAGTVLAHSGDERPLYVAAGGADAGDCQDPSAPCRTLGYALSVAGKGAEIRVAAGSYEVADPAVLLHLVSGSVDVVGGWSRSDGFAKPGAGATTLVGVPPEYRSLLEPQGFGVIADTKGLDAETAAVAGKLLAQYRAQQAGLAAAECVNGAAAGLACSSVDLLAHVPLGAVSARPLAGNDVWGFVDLNTGREYAIAGFDIGTAVFDVTDPADPREIGFVDGQRTTWRDIKVYQVYDPGAGRWHAFAYVTADNVTEGLFVLDLGGLPHTIAKTGFTSDFVRAHNLQIGRADPSTGVALTDLPPHLVIAGSNLTSGAFRAYSLADPAVPAFLAAGSTVPGGSASIYTHDAATAIVTDARVAACASGLDYCEVLLDFNEDQLLVWDVTDPAAPEPLAVRGYANASYVHSGWWSEDRRFFFVHDEQDEQLAGLNTTVRVFSIDDLSAPAQVGVWAGPTRAIDHNGFVRGNRYYVANYTRGFTVLDISNPANPQDVGFIDVYPPSDGVGFQGAWGTYPYFTSGTIAINDIDSGLYLVRDRTLDVPQGRLGFQSATAAGEEGGFARLVVERTGGTQGAVEVGLELVHATAQADDYTPPVTTLSWAAGDATPRNVDLPLAADANAEGLESLLVRLVAPTGGATLGDVNVATVYVSEPAAAASIAFFEPAIETTERGFNRAVVVLRRSGSARDAVSVDFTVADGTAAAGQDFDGALTGTITWPAGDADPRSIVFDIVDDGVAEGEETFTVSLGNASGAAIEGPSAATVAIVDTRNRAPNAVPGGSQTVAANARVTLNGSGSNDPDGDSLTYAWEQVDGPGVTLAGANAATAEFTAPAVGSDTLLRFRLTVTDPGGLSDSGTVAVTVTARDSGGGGSGAVGGALLGVLSLVALLSRRRGGAARSSARDPARSR